jgi:ABC-type transport system involved in cytochrome c biogenesis permease subunit
MLASLSEVHFFLAAIVCLLASAATGILRPRSRVATLATASLGVVFLIAGLAFAAVRRDSRPLATPAELMLAAVTAAVSLHTLRIATGKANSAALPETLAQCTVAVGLIVWGFLRLPPLQSPAVAGPVTSTESMQQPWLVASQLLLALACGALVEAGSLAMAHMWSARQYKGQPISADREGLRLVPVGLAALMGSLWLRVLEGVYGRGAYWSWNATESWQLLLWLYYAALWCACTMNLSGSARRLRLPTVLGLMLIILFLRAAGA